MKFSRFIIGGVLTLSLLGGMPIALAQQQAETAAQATSAKIDESTLTRLYDQSLKYPENGAISARIADERKKIHTQLEDEVRAQMQALQDGGDLAGEELVTAVERTRTDLAATDELLKSRKIDLDGLASEEKDFYLNPTPASGSGTLRLTTSHAELLAKRAITEERISVLSGLEALQQERLDKLIFEQRLEQFHILIVIGKYVAIITIIFLFERMLRGLLLERIRNRDRRYTVTKVFTGTIYGFTIVWLLSVLFAKQPGILAGVAIVGAGLAISLQDTVKDLIGWISIHRSQLYSKGDRITVNGITGEVIDIGMFYTTLLEVGVEGAPVLERTGKILFVPNAMMLTQIITNYHATSDFLRAEMHFSITYESDWRRAEVLLKGILEDITNPLVEEEQRQYGARTRRFYIPHSHPQPVVHMDIGMDGIDFTLRFTVPVGERRPVVTEITRRVLDAFKPGSGIELAYKTSRVYSTALPSVDENS